MWENSTQILNVVPNFISLCFLVDALYRLRNIARGAMHIETWQLVWHIWSFVLTTIAGIFLSIATHHAWRHAKFFYLTYDMIIVMIFLCELPFLYIIHKVV
jgi:hypothetical protein